MDAKKRKRYNAAAIGDFFKQLEVEARLRRATATHRYDLPPHPELTSWLATYVARRGQLQLLVADFLAPTDAPAEIRQEADELLRSREVSRAEEILSALQILKPHIKEALASIRAREILVREWDPRGIIEILGGDY